MIFPKLLPLNPAKNQDYMLGMDELKFGCEIGLVNYKTTFLLKVKFRFNL